jgi:Ca2+-binding EF-hand superfamily protein
MASRGLVEILSSVRERIAARGAKTIAGLGRTFRALDSYDGNKKVDAQEFAVGLAENGIELTREEAQTLFQYFDTDGDGTVNFDEFLVGIRGTPNPRR